jgi:glucose dehydrogenase
VQSGVLLKPDLVWSGGLDGTFTAYDQKTLAPVWSINVGTALRAPPMTYTAGGKQYVAIEGGAIGGNAFGHDELSSMQSADMVWVFTIN